MNVYYGQSAVLNGRWKDAEGNKAKTPVLSCNYKGKRKTVNRSRPCWRELTSTENMKQGRDEGCRWKYTAGRKGPWEKMTFEKNHQRDRGMSHLAIWQMNITEVAGAKVLRQKYKPVGWGDLSKREWELEWDRGCEGQTTESLGGICKNCGFSIERTKEFLGVWDTGVT